MTKLAICEKKGIEKDIQISGYYKKDYASLKKWITLIGITIGYGLAAALFAGCGGKSSSAENGELNLFIWTEYVPDAVIEKFEKDFAIVTALVVKKQTLGGINHGSKSSD